MDIDSESQGSIYMDRDHIFADKRLIPNKSLRYDSINEDFYEGRPLKKDFDEMKDYIKRNRSTLQDYFQLKLHCKQLGIIIVVC